MGDQNKEPIDAQNPWKLQKAWIEEYSSFAFCNKLCLNFASLKRLCRAVHFQPITSRVGVCKNVEPTGSGTSSDNGKGGELDTAEPEEIAQDECLGNKAEKGVVKINSQGSIKPLKLVQIVVTVFVPAFNDTLLAASACKTLSPSPGKGERTKYQTILVG
ncbi:unnamed protein product [Vicia faba]|uniref:Uncharacterized protein n=1 Tax=Vicia faba TaxID=3906 RepID=A0AAV1B2V4_VICFA|nr:unnamed protein product [Vicia faba]